MMGQEGEASQSGDDLPGWARRFRVLPRSQGEIAAPIVPAGTSRFTPSGELVLVRLKLSISGHGLLAEAEVGGVDPHPVENHGELSGDRDLGFGHAAAPGNGQARRCGVRGLRSPARGAQRRPLAAAHQERVRGLDPAGSGAGSAEFVAAPSQIWGLILPVISVSPD